MNQQRNRSDLTRNQLRTAQPPLLNSMTAIILTRVRRQANKADLKVAELSADFGEYDKATEFFERVGYASLSNNLMKYSVKDYYFKAGICHLATGVRTNFVLA